MKIIDFTGELRDFKGEIISESEYDNQGKLIKSTPLLIGEYFANIISSSQSENSRKMADWAREVYKKKKIQVDKTDESFLTEFINSQKVANLLKDQILQRFDDAKETK